MKKHSYVPVIAILCVASSIFVAPAQGQSVQTRTYHYPIAYVGTDNNLYLTSLEGKKPPILVMRHAQNMRLGNVRWAPDGSRFVVAEYAPLVDMGTPGLYDTNHKLYLVESGRGPVWLSQVEIGRPALSAWSPDGSQLAYVRDQFRSVMTILFPAGQPNDLSVYVNTCSGDSPVYAQEEYLSDEELGGIFTLSSPYTLQWTSYGILTASGCGSPITMTAPNGTKVWQWDHFAELSLPIVSPDGKEALTSYLNPVGDTTDRTTQGFVGDLRTGTFTPSDILKGTKPVAWSTDSKYIFYATETDNTFVLGKPGHATIGRQFFPDWPGVASERSTIAIWQRRRDGSGMPRRLFRREGHSIGAFAVMPDDSAIVFSFVTSSARRLEAINVGQSAKQVAQFDTAHVEVIAVSLHDGSIRRIALGGQPTIGSGDFVAKLNN